MIDRDANVIDKEIDEVIRESLHPFPRLRSVYFKNIYPTRYKYKVSLVSLMVDFRKSKKIERKRNNLSIYKFNSAFSSIMREDILSASQLAASKGSKILVFSEYSYPILQDRELRPELMRLAEKYDCCVIPGSYYEVNEKKPDFGSEKSPIFSNNNEPIIQFKNQGGRILGELDNIRTPLQQYTNLCETKYGTFAVVVGNDILDNNLLHNIKILNYKNNIYKPVDLIIVPSFSDSPARFGEFCRNFSRNTQTYVLYVTDKRYGLHSNVYMCGKELKPEVIRSDDNLDIRTYDIDIATLRNMRINVNSYEFKRIKI